MQNFVIIYCREDEVLVKRKVDSSLLIYKIEDLLEDQNEGKCHIVNMDIINNYLL